MQERVDDKMSRNEAPTLSLPTRVGVVNIAVGNLNIPHGPHLYPHGFPNPQQEEILKIKYSRS